MELPYSFAQFREHIVKDISDGTWIYRGHSNKDWQLKSSFARYCDKLNVNFSTNIFYELLEQFINKASDFYAKDFFKLTIVEQIAFAQHHGLPTPFLDWTESPYIATFFAVYDDFLNINEPFKIWALNISDIKNVLLDHRNNFKDSQFSLIETKLYNSRRLLRQMGCFTYLDSSNCLYEFSKKNYSNIRIKKYLINAEESRINILNELRMMGITAANIFDDIDGVAFDVMLKTFPKK